MAINFIKELFERSDASGSKSTILKPLTWLISILLGAVILLQKVSAPSWLIIFLVSIVGLTILIFFFSYIFCLFKNPEALRSEKYSIQKLAIEKGIYGDDINGTYKLNSENKTKEIDASNQSEKKN